MGGWGAYTLTIYKAVRVLPARGEARVLLAFFSVARASATHYKAAPPLAGVNGADYVRRFGLDLLCTKCR